MSDKVEDILLGRDPHKHPHKLTPSRRKPMNENLEKLLEAAEAVIEEFIAEGSVTTDKKITELEYRVKKVKDESNV